MVVTNFVDSRQKTTCDSKRVYDDSFVSGSEVPKAADAVSNAEKYSSYDVVRLFDVRNRMPVVANRPVSASRVAVSEAALRAMALRLFMSDSIPGMLGFDAYESNLAMIRQKLLEKEMRLLEYFDRLTPEDTCDEFSGLFSESDARYIEDLAGNIRPRSSPSDAEGRKRALSREYEKRLGEIKERYTGKLARTHIEGLDKAFRDYSDKIDGEYRKTDEGVVFDERLLRFLRGSSFASGFSADGYLRLRLNAGGAGFADSLTGSHPALFEYCEKHGLADGGLFSHVLLGKRLQGQTAGLFLRDASNGGDNGRSEKTALIIRANEFSPPAAQPELSVKYRLACEAQFEKIFAGLDSNPSMTLDAQLSFQSKANESWIEGLRRTDPELFNFHLYSHRAAVEAGKPELAWLPPGMTVAEYRAYITDEWVRWANSFGFGNDVLRKKRKTAFEANADDSDCRLTGVVTVFLVFMLWV